MMISELLRTGSNQAATMDELKARTGLGERELFAAISHERAEGFLICNAGAGRGGYYIPATPDEMKQTYYRQRRRAISILRSVEPLRKALQIPVGQISLDLEKMAAEIGEGTQDGKKNEVSCKKF